jgi:hypothetical protein
VIAKRILLEKIVFIINSVIRVVDYEIESLDDLIGGPGIPGLFDVVAERFGDTISDRTSSRVYKALHTLLHVGTPFITESGIEGAEGDDPLLEDIAEESSMVSCNVVTNYRVIHVPKTYEELDLEITGDFGGILQSKTMPALHDRLISLKEGLMMDIVIRTLDGKDLLVTKNWASDISEPSFHVTKPITII